MDSSVHVGHQAPLSMGFPRQEYWSGLPCPSPGDLPDPGMEPVSPVLAGRFFTAEPQRKPCIPLARMKIQTLKKIQKKKKLSLT